MWHGMAWYGTAVSEDMVKVVVTNLVLATVVVIVPVAMYRGMLRCSTVYIVQSNLFLS